MEVERESLLQVTARARAQAERDSRAKSEFLGMMSHELRTPLNAIAGYAQLIEEGVHGPISDEQRTDLMRIQRSQRYLLGVIDNVLSFLKLGGGRVLYDLAEFDVADAIQSVDELVRPLIAAKGLRYERRLSPRSVLVRADRNKLQQILLNLLSNAVKFTDSGGTITIAWARESDEVRIRVEDTGWGIPAERLENVFEPFTQIDSTRSRAAGGTGLGLTISREFARGMGGNLSVKSEPAKGSVFTVALPVAGLGFDDRGPPSETG
jgi:signal transduction histidine kinase